MNKLAIVIPYYKIDFFEETLKSVAQQTDKRFTLYIGNDNSLNNPLELIDKYLKKDDYNYFDYKENLGGNNLVLQWERILENVTEEWFQILGDDDMIRNNFVEEFYNNIDKVVNNNINVIKISQAFIDDQSKKYTEFSIYPSIITTREFIKDKFFLSGRSSLSEHIFNFSFFKKNKFKKYPLAWHSDDMMVINFSVPHGVYFMNTTNVFVRFSDKSISGNINNDKNNNLKEVATYIFFGDLLNNYLNYIDKNNIKEFLRMHLYRSWKIKKRNNINLLSVYLYTNQYFKILTIPYKEYLLNKNARKN